MYLSLTRRDGGLLTAFLALFVTIAGTSFWRIACFTLHYILSSPTPRDGIYHQRQAILRNAANGTAGLWSLVQLNWAWRNHTVIQLCRRILPLTTLTVVILAAFAVASVFSSQVTTSMGNDALLLGSNCGINNLTGTDARYYMATFLPYMVQRLISSATYAQECYYQRSATTQNCPTFVQRSLPWTTTRDVGCPFPGGDKICRSNSTNLRIDSGYINSHINLGINAPQEDRFLFRTVIECAPLKTEGYSENVTLNLPENSTNSRQVMQYKYGGLFHGAEGQSFNNSVTYQYSADPVLGLGGYYGTPSFPYHGIPFSANNDYTVQ